MQHKRIYTHTHTRVSLYKCVYDTWVSTGLVNACIHIPKYRRSMMSAAATLRGDGHAQTNNRSGK